MEARLGWRFEQKDMGRVSPGPLCRRNGGQWRSRGLPARAVGLDPRRELLGNLSWAGQGRWGRAASAARLKARPWQLRCGGWCKQDGSSVVKWLVAPVVVVHPVEGGKGISCDCFVFL